MLSHTRRSLKSAATAFLRQASTKTKFKAGDKASKEEAEQVANIVAKAFDKNPGDTATAIMERLDDLDKVHLFKAFQITRNEGLAFTRSREYAYDLIKSIPKDSPHKILTRAEVENTIEMQRYLLRYSVFAETPPTFRQLFLVALASGLPFVAFGFIDNAIMISAGDYIDISLGTRLGITTLASAGLGNIVADVAGVSATQQIKELSRRLPWAQPPRLSVLQQSMARVRIAKLTGAAVCVSVGCVMGMLPLAFLPPGFFAEKEEEVGDGVEISSE